MLMLCIWNSSTFKKYCVIKYNLLKKYALIVSPDFVFSRLRSQALYYCVVEEWKVNPQLTV